MTDKDDALAKAIWAYWDTHGDVDEPAQDCADQAARAARAWFHEHYGLPEGADEGCVGKAMEALVCASQCSSVGAMYDHIAEAQRLLGQEVEVAE